MDFNRIFTKVVMLTQGVKWICVDQALRAASGTGRSKFLWISASIAAHLVGLYFFRKAYDNREIDLQDAQNEHLLVPEPNPDQPLQNLPNEPVLAPQQDQPLQNLPNELAFVPPQNLPNEPVLIPQPDQNLPNEQVLEPQLDQPLQNLPNELAFVPNQEPNEPVLLGLPHPDQPLQNMQNELAFVPPQEPNELHNIANEPVLLGLPHPGEPLENLPNEPIFIEIPHLGEPFEHEENGELEEPEDNLNLEIMNNIIILAPAQDQNNELN